MTVRENIELIPKIKNKRNKEKEGKKEEAEKLLENVRNVLTMVGLDPEKNKRNKEKEGKKEEAEKLLENVRNVLTMVGLDPDEYMDKYPVQMSGGQQQRVGVARAFASNPDIILMDEPFSALDPITRNQLQDELVALQDKLRKTIVFVTHDMGEAIKLADRICILNEGKIQQFDTPEQILKHPANDFVLNFVGKKRIWDSPELIKAEDIMIENPIVCISRLKAIKRLKI